ncbi:glycosyltransferase family 2 protein [Tabrizicola sp.]|uniref:glycosyltransferase family 2 protein n=1 Tax=Tabrizicola sp. TaxID=2005166 RepID=UPI0025E04C5C|nr:glycosyltransferase family 2 protein [Tabrizicola sp.]MBY0350375.1 glycosyltransferase family 2 protein [Tabrizicola sp.]MDK2775433.1 glycosyltransferase family 2 protein [Tabrizicola sp.]
MTEEQLPGPTVLTVLLNWRTAEMTLRAAESAERAMEGIAGGIVVVDNDSNDGSFETMSAALQDRPRFRVVQSGRNGGFGAGNNVGIRLGLPGGVRPDYVYILNSDAFPAPDAIRLLLDYLERHPKVGFAGSYIHGPDGEPHVTCFRFPSVASEFEGAARSGPISRLLRHRAVAIGVPLATGPVDWLAGASMMMREDVIRTVGGFDETFFLYFEETDLCRRAAEAGWPTHFVKESRVEHIGSVSTGMKTWKRVPGYWFDSRWHYFRKSGGTSRAVLATLAHVAGGLILRARRLVQPKIPGGPPHFLRDLVGHALLSLFGKRSVSRR